MAFVEWEMEGAEFVNCSCEWGCPCQFNSLPTTATAAPIPSCRSSAAATATCRSTGCAGACSPPWPGPIHLGGGTFQVIVDERADARQRAGARGDRPGPRHRAGHRSIWQIFSTTVTTLLPTLARPSTSTIDVDERTASMRFPAWPKGSVAPIRNREDRRAAARPRDAAGRLRVHGGGVRGRQRHGRRRHPARLQRHARAPGAHPLDDARRGAVAERHALDRGQTAVERAVRHDRGSRSGRLVVLSLACWAWIVPMATDMYGVMQGPSAWMMTARVGPPFTLLLLVMWTAMMAAMMLPSAVPTLLLYGLVARRAIRRAAPALRVHIFAGGYLAGVDRVQRRGQTLAAARAVAARACCRR